ncbi:hypothetical protein FA95DRAFT_1078610 [Auriscalpium vulgare]|uniref:Uncharacterized protein n=1 Tax=Auriscalpium vulgare TaxID=40419 RepID=A0ACB8R516_9AGAM|nr:hypothetical protein FA95DRAFT_1078610 [Auriscalpium vulgare]
MARLRRSLPACIHAVLPQHSVAFTFDLPPPSVLAFWHMPSQSKFQSRVPHVTGAVSDASDTYLPVDEVLEWLQSKGSDQGVCKVHEARNNGLCSLRSGYRRLHDRYGDHSSRQCMRIANAIAELRRPPSIITSDHLPAHSHLLSQSLSHSHSSTASSTRQSMNSSYTNNTGPSPAIAVDPLGTAGLHSVMCLESPPH